MKKVLALVLALTMVLGSFSFVSAATFPDTSAVSVNVLSGLGVINGYPDGTFKPANIVTRAEMAKMIVVALGLEDFAVATTSPYSDMWQAQWAQGFVSYATSLGIITGYPDGTFKPNQTVSYNEASAMIVRALGYTSEFLPGEWPAEWVVKAKTLGILDGITAATAAGATRGDIAKMLYSALDEEIGYVNKDGDWIATRNDTMLSRLGATLVEGEIILGDEDSLINLRPYVGKYVDYYENSDEEIIVVKVRSTTLTGVFNTASEFEADGVKYSGANDEPHKIFVNGDAISGSYTPNTDATYTLEVKLSGKSITEVYSLSKWVVTQHDYFAKSDAEDIDLDQILFGEDFVLDSDDDIDLMSFELVGVASLDEIEKDDIVYVYASAEGIRKIEVGNAVIEGEVTRVNSAADTITVGGKAYKFAVNELEYNGAPGFAYSAAEVKEWIGEDVTLYLDAHGFIYEVETDAASADTYAVYLNKDESTSVRIPDALRLFLPDGTAKWFDVDSSTTFDTFVALATPGAIVKYGVNDDGEIDVIALQTVVDDAEGKVTNFFDRKAIASDVVIFTFDGGTATDASKYGITTLDKIKDSSFDSGEIEYVYVSPSIRVIKLVDSGVSAADDVYGIFSAKYLDRNSSTDRMVTFWVEGAKTDYEITSAFYDSINLNKYTLVQIEFNGKGQVTGTTGAAVVVSDTLSSNISSGMIKVGGTTLANEYFVETGAFIYTWDGTTLKVGSTSHLRTTVADVVTLYDTNDNGIADVIVVDLK